MTISIDLLTAINHLCTYVESKILLAVIYYDGVTPTFAQIQKVTGITQSNNYFRTRKRLIDLNYLIIDNNGMCVNVDTILKDYKEGFKC
jgi:hypothetical protein